MQSVISKIMSTMIEEETDLSPVFVGNEDGHNALQGYVQKRSLKVRFMPCFGTSYRQRYLVLRGKFLFRYVTNTSKKNKGVPIDLEYSTVEVFDQDHDDNAEIVLYGISISSMSKTIIFAVENEDERQRWIAALRDAKQLAIKQRLGHAKVEPWEKATTHVGKQRIQEKERAEQIQYNTPNIAQPY